MKTWQKRWRWWLLAALAAAGASGAWVSWQRRSTQVAIGVDLPLMPGAAIDPSDRYSADLVLEQRPSSRMRFVNHYNAAEPASGPASIAELKRRGVGLFITTQASSHAVPSLGQFQSGDALAINVSATSNALSGKNDFFFRVVPDLVQEQKAIAQAIHRFPGRRVLVITDTGNTAYTRPALEVFTRELSLLGHWQTEIRPLKVTAFLPQRDQRLMRGDYDALYILAGSFQPSIGNISQLFHQLHPKAPIVLTPWARSPAITQNAGPAAAQCWVVSPYPSRRKDPRVNRYFQRFEQRFGFIPYAMGIGTSQATELMDQALASGARTPAEVKRYLLSKPEHGTSFGAIRFDANGDVRASFHTFRATEDEAP